MEDRYENQYEAYGLRTIINNWRNEYMSKMLLSITEME
jgi:hypothetical protein